MPQRRLTTLVPPALLPRVRVVHRSKRSTPVFEAEGAPRFTTVVPPAFLPRVSVVHRPEGAVARAIAPVESHSILRGAVPYALLLLASFTLWAAGMKLLGASSLLVHNTKDQHTRQARAWLQGRLDLPSAPSHLEIARKDGRLYNSFPPTPSLMEVPLVMVFGRQTPNSLLLYAFLMASVIATYQMALERRFSRRDAWLLAMASLFATNLYVSCTSGSVWALGQGLGYSLAILGARLVMLAESRRAAAAGYCLLSMAVGCRPFLLFLAPILVALDPETRRGETRTSLVTAAAGMGPFLALLSVHNWIRFGSPMEFGHNYLAWAMALPRGLFSLSYLPDNAYHALLRLPDWRRAWPYLRFDANGTAFWLNNAVVPISVYALVRRRLDGRLRVTAALAFIVISLSVLCYASNGWRQFGYRYMIDVLPIALLVFIHTHDRLSRPVLAALAASFAVNLYGLLAWRDMPY